ncbi:hypothetical protein CS063_05615 [Sporanaerobium hydrogeniformans]|uniref:Uncharacterized protein n=1 Tax=Sporanaerobium hydrogeniformans TaxID=3072179 RepID=A0AC61DEQ6_9FIRM|nr:DUF1292 domain-containing protein [Sporanaerobium hydrogeniformans]PHV71523.1 hypothetical protein CS063_05615 [Sporanaerobium hydrogeniformans]
MEKIKFVDEETKEEILFEVMDEAVLEGTKYLLVVDEEDVATILKQVEEKDDEIDYVLVEEEDEFKRVAVEFMSSEEYDIEV